MDYRPLGHSELRVPPIIFGAWAAGGWYWGPQDDADSIRAIHAALDAGITCIDTAPIYGMGHSEEIVGKAIKGRRHNVTLATKCGLRWDTPGEGCHHWVYKAPDGSEHTIVRNLRRHAIIAEVEHSLKRLGTDVIDLYQCHWPDPSTPIAETMEAMLTLKTQGKIRAIGVSNFTPDMMAECLKTAPLASDQPKYSLLTRDIEADVLPFCRTHNIAVIVYSPLEQGLLTGKVTMERTFPAGDYRGGRPWFLPQNRRRVLDALEKAKPIAAAHNATLGQLAIAWVIAQPGVTAAIVGARNPDQARENARAANIKLSPADLATIRKLFDGLGQPLA